MAKGKEEKRKSRVVSKAGQQTQAAPGYKFAASPKKGQPATKKQEVVKGAKQVSMPNAPYIPKPAGPGAKAASAPAKQKKTKSNWKGGSAKMAKSGRGYKIKSKKAPGC